MSVDDTWRVPVVRANEGRNQFAVVPVRIEHRLETYFLHRRDMMQHIKQEDIEQQKVERNRED